MELVMEKIAIRNLYTEHHRRGLQIPNFRRVFMPPVVRFINETSPRSFINYSLLTPDIVADTIEREVLYFTRIGHDFEWKIYDYDPPADLSDQLAANGFKIGEEEALLVLDTHNLPERLQSVTDHDIREITDPDHLLEVLTMVQGDVFGDASWVDETLSESMRKDANSIQFFAAYVDDGPVSAAWISYSEGDNPFAGLYGGATLEAHRGQGHYSALIAARAQAARSRGVRYLHVDASPMSRPILEKIGFLHLATTWEATYTVGNDND
jgi:GNAT superfamily N-acetyltransferase